MHGWKMWLFARLHAMLHRWALHCLRMYQNERFSYMHRHGVCPNCGRFPKGMSCMAKLC